MLSCKTGVARLIFLFGDLAGSDTALFLTLVSAVIVALVIGIGFHEFCHAFMATVLGDRLPASQGRVTLNPLAHLDGFGTVMMLFVGFGWGKPVQFNPFGLKVSPKTATLLVSLAGPLSNFVAAGLLGIPLKLGWVPYFSPFWNPAYLKFYVTSGGDYTGLFLTSAVYFNIILGVFNLLPIHPLDGFKVVLGILPDDLAQEWAKTAQYGVGILMILLLLPLVFAMNPLNDIMGPTVSSFVHFFTGY
jgi:Zn-dependent protease